MRRWLTSALLAIFVLLPFLQLQCEIACADDDAATTVAISQARDSSVATPASLSSPDDCVGREAPSPMLPRPTSIHGSVVLALILHAAPDDLLSGGHAFVPPAFDNARPRGSTGIGLPLRI